MDRLPLLRIASTSCLVWAGVSLGTSLAAASKRTSPLLTPPVAVDIQRRISGTSLAVEAALAAAAAAALAAAPAAASAADEDANGVVHALRQASVDSVFYSRKSGGGGKVTVAAAAPKVAVAASSSPATERGPSHAFAHKLYVAAEAGKMLSAGMAGFFLIP